MGVCLAVCLSVFSCSDPLAGWLRKMCFRCPGTGHRGSPYFPILRSYPHAFLLLWLPVGYWWPAWHGPNQYPATCKTGYLYLLFQLLWRPLPCESGLPWVSWEGGWAQRRMSYLGGQEAKKLDRKWVWRTEVYLWYLKSSLSVRRLKKAPSFQFPSSISRAGTGLEGCPWSVGPVLSVIHLSVPTFKWQSSWPCHGQSMSGILAWLLLPNLELRKYMHRSQRDVFISDCT